MKGSGGVQQQYADKMADSLATDHVDLVTMLRTTDDPWTHISDRLLQFGSPTAVRAEVGEPLLFDDRDTDVLDAARSDVSRWATQGLRMLMITDDDYPARVRDIHEAPPFLFARGTLVRDDQAVSVVGSRDASDAGLAFARQVSALLVREGLTVASGLAAGIDTAAHTTALAGAGRTVAFLGTGITKYYPAANRDLQDVIAARGLLLSQFWPDAPPTKKTFPMRNAVMSGYGIATVVVEAGEHSGARIQARVAVQHGRPVILTERVVRGTTWGRSMQGQPDVYVVSEPHEAIDIVANLRSRASRLAMPVEQLLT